MSQRMRILPRLVVFALLTSAVAYSSPRQQAGYDAPPINYSKGKPSDPVAVLDARLASGRSTLDYEAQHGYLKAVLKELDIPASSQSLVFSKTSFQRQW